ncbi:M13 family metallopeptidase [Salmonirosea aquatica]|uniref:M13 family peptidase n=1 Tax=Salmonirosea aquatica TaxID=2654236 RepID=A0A7C9FYW4_9BACT|nr:M13 family peptidase [Cytophagaceae bacterium SJW1-29]
MTCKTKAFLLLLVGIGFLSTDSFAQKKEVKPLTPEKFIDPANMDLSAKPGDDFYTYASGNWIKNNPVPAKETRWGSFNVLRDFNIEAVRGLLDDAATNKNAPAGSVERRVSDFYKSAMDSAAIEKLGYTPIKADLQKLNGINSKQAAIEQIAKARTMGMGSPFYGFYVGQDRKNVEVMVPQFSQGGTTLPDRDYYLKDDARSQKIRAGYRDYIVKLFTLTGTPEAQAKSNADAIMKLETELARAQMPRVEMRDPQKTYNKLSVAEFSKSTPHFDWQKIMPMMMVKGEDTVLVNNPKFFVKADSLFNATSLPDLKTYLTWNLLKSSASYLSSDFVDANFAFNQVLTGQKIQTPRWQRMSQLTDRTIGELLGQLYVKKYFTPAAKQRMDELIKNLVKAYEQRIKGLEWMSDETKEKALAKLHNFTPKIGYPEKWQTYEGFDIKPTTFYANVKNGDAWDYKDMVNKLGKPVDKTLWGMTPPTVNAYYNPVQNEIVFPAGILQFPFFDPNADDAVNYGGIGAVIGHEISHGFDDSGSQYDKDGYLRNWWTENDRKKFVSLADRLVEQYNNYTVLDTLHVNGRLTLGENIGDLGGLNAAYTAFKMTPQGKSNEKIDGFTPDQRFFLAWAQVWRTNILPEAAAQQVLVDPHSPGEWRTIGPLINMDAWYQAFNVKPGDKLYVAPEKRIYLW